MNTHLENTYSQLPDQFYQKRNPDQVKNPELIKYNSELAEELNINLDNLSDEEKAEYFSGNKLFPNSQPIAQVYAGHQFWYFSSRLWDGRAVLLWEILDKNNLRKDIVLKWSGETMYSRWGDGKATLWSVIREYIMSEAMFHLGIPTSRTLAVTATGEQVFREGILPWWIVTRVASSHIRFWTFEYFLRNWDLEWLKILADYSINRHYSELELSENKYIEFLEKVMNKHIDLVVNWMRVWFIHGVMNTDNMLICWETIDYGPCAFMDTYNKNTVFSSIDPNGRYSFMNQKYALEWNLARFWETLIPLLSENTDEAIKILENILNNFDKYFDEKYFKMMNNKIWIFQEELFDNNLVEEILNFLENNQIDYTDFFKDLGKSISEENIDNIFEKYNFIEIKNISEAKNIFERLENILQKQSLNFDEIWEMMNKINPSIIPRNYKIEYIIDKAQRESDFSEFEKVCDILKNPYTQNNEASNYIKAPAFINKNYKTFCGT